MKIQWNKGIAQLVLCVSISVLLTACGGGGSTTAGSNQTSSVNLTGTVAVGRALTNATVAMTDAAGMTRSTTSDSNGRYTFDVTGLTTPFVITSVDPFGVAGKQYSVVPALPRSGNNIIANVTPLTTAVAAMLTSSGNPADLLANLSSVTASNVNTAVSKLNTALSSMLAANGLNASTFDPIGQTFTPNQTGADAVIESVNVVPSSVNGGLQLMSVADPNTVIQLNGNTSVSSALTASAQPANFLVALTSQLNQCMTTRNAASPACAAIINANYVRAGGSFAQSSGLLQPGLTLNGVKAVAFFPAGTIPNTTGQTALVYITYTTSSGSQLFTRDFVQQKSDGSWEFIGDQVTKNITINSFLTRKQLVQDGSVRYEAGIDISAWPSSFEWTSVNVTGPGLPSGGLWLQSLGLTAYAGIPSFQAPSRFLNNPSVALGGSVYGSDQITNQYKMTWTDGNGKATARINSSDYAPAPIDMSTIPLYATYTATFYDSQGTQVGAPQQVMNTSTSMTNAVQGVSTEWPTLGQHVVASLLTPSGSLASGPIAPDGNPITTTFDWAIPNATSAINVQSIFVNLAYATPGNPGYPDQTMVKTIGGLTGASTITKDSTGTQFSGQVVLNSTSEALSAEPRRNVQLKWYQNGVTVSGVWQYGTGE